MASYFILQLPQLIYCSKYSGLDNKRKFLSSALFLSNLHPTHERHNGLSENSLSNGFCFNCYSFSRWFSSLGLSSKVSAAYIDRSSSENEVTKATTYSQELDFNRVNYLEWKLHESARSFSNVVESLGFAGSSPELAMAWLGKDVNDWHKRIAYRVAIYALMKTAIDVEILLSHEPQYDLSPVREILTPLTNLVGEDIESQLKMRPSELVDWFRAVELPRVAGYFVPFLKKWSMEYAGSGVAGIIVAITCCAAVVKLGSGRVSCPLLISSIDDVLVELLEFSHNHVTVDKLHQLATEAGFEQDFLCHFGKKVLPNEKCDDLEFWIGLAHKKLSEAFSKESVFSDKQNVHYKVQADRLATLGLFAYLGRRTRIFLSALGIKDLDEIVKDFLSYLECGSLFIYPEFSSLSVYQLFMEVVTYEIAWLDFYAESVCINCQDRRRSKHHAIQAEKEIILSVVFTVCYDVFLGFAHFSRSTQQPIDKALLAFLLRSQSLLTVCLEDYWAAYDKSSEPLKIMDKAVLDNPTSFVKSISGPTLSFAFEAQWKSRDLIIQGLPRSNSQHESILRKDVVTAATDTSVQGATLNKSNPQKGSFIKGYGIKLASASSLLFVDIVVALKLLLRQVRGQKATRSERKRLERTLNDVGMLIPMTILMLLPVSAVGHAAMLAAINKYVPWMIPSPYSSERLDVVKQLKRTKTMEIHLWSNFEDPTSTIS
ncbi:LETM1-like protein [Quillaja saponaria]|uniref:LETM1-like protein n=1 Tax=Quillaja saponaria TaxID=32244 RepID=A0AAD7LTE6_QUISA|nr:LETM1-like protein [Quillaja saponaria]